MLTQLSTVKSRLAIASVDTQYDALLTSTVKAVSARFDKETRRTLARTVAVAQEFAGDDTEILTICYPIESVTRFELKTNETDGWIEQTNIQFLIRRACIISLSQPISFQPSAPYLPPAARVIYDGGYVLPGTTPATGQTPLPDDLEQAAVEQVAAWFMNRDKLGLDTIWPHGGTYMNFTPSDLLREVRAVLNKYRRWTP